MKFAEKADIIFRDTVEHYHKTDDVDHKPANPYTAGSVDALLFDKCWIDAVQWHLEDIIRDPNIKPDEALSLKRRIDRSNQDRTDMVEMLDSWFLQKYNDVKPKEDATINTESPAWAFDRLSILELKIYHMLHEVNRKDATDEHKIKCEEKLKVLLLQREDLISAIDRLLEDIAEGRKYMKVYKQMKMYNDPATNPILYGKKG